MRMTGPMSPPSRLIVGSVAHQSGLILRPLQTEAHQNHGSDRLSGDLCRVPVAAAIERARFNQAAALKYA